MWRNAARNTGAGWTTPRGSRLSRERWIRPQQARVKQHKAMIEAVKKGDVAVTGGGLIGRVSKVDGDEVEIELAPNVRVRAVKSTLTEVRGTTKPAND